MLERADKISDPPHLRTERCGLVLGSVLLYAAEGRNKTLLQEDQNKSGYLSVCEVSGQRSNSWKRLPSTVEQAFCDRVCLGDGEEERESAESRLEEREKKKNPANWWLLKMHPTLPRKQHYGVSPVNSTNSTRFNCCDDDAPAQDG